MKPKDLNIKVYENIKLKSVFGKTDKTDKKWKQKKRQKPLK
jgi:hypothetical protein